MQIDSRSVYLDGINPHPQPPRNVTPAKPKKDYIHIETEKREKQHTYKTSCGVGEGGEEEDNIISVRLWKHKAAFYSL